jgi:hypothetical protein
MERKKNGEIDIMEKKRNDEVRKGKGIERKRSGVEEE